MLLVRIVWVVDSSGQPKATMIQALLISDAFCCGSLSRLLGGGNDTTSASPLYGGAVFGASKELRQEGQVLCGL